MTLGKVAALVPRRRLHGGRQGIVYAGSVRDPASPVARARVMYGDPRPPLVRYSHSRFDLVAVDFAEAPLVVLVRLMGRVVRPGATRGSEVQNAPIGGVGISGSAPPLPTISKA